LFLRHAPRGTRDPARESESRPESRRIAIRDRALGPRTIRPSAQSRRSRLRQSFRPLFRAPASMPLARLGEKSRAPRTRRRSGTKMVNSGSPAGSKRCGEDARGELVPRISRGQWQCQRCVQGFEQFRMFIERPALKSPCEMTSVRLDGPLPSCPSFLHWRWGPTPSAN
jgi:hypothetical protein